MRLLPFLSVAFACFVLPPSVALAGEREDLEREAAELAKKIDAIKPRYSSANKNDLLADAEVFLKGAQWALRYDTTLQPADIALIKKSLRRGLERCNALTSDQSPWTRKLGKQTRGYVSAVDGSTQPYGIIVPKKYDSSKPIRLDVVLHGSSKPVGLSELRFMARFDEGDAETKNAPDVDHIELHPLGRVENCYRWAGETDVFEAIDVVCRQYNIDRDRIVLRGMSMGASGTWHLGLKHPDRFVALGPYCGYVDTHQFSRTPIAGFVQVGELPIHQELGLHMLDSVDYAANAGVVPAIACIGEKDVFFQAHVIMGKAMANEGLQMVNLISPGTGHVIDPLTHEKQMKLIGEYARKGLDHRPKHIRFVTWTLKFNRCHWLQIDALGEHYQRAELEADIKVESVVEVKEPKNITRFTIASEAFGNGLRRLIIGGKEIPIAYQRGSIVVAKRGGRWVVLSEKEASKQTGKTPGLQGPIDDAFVKPFLCVRGTGDSWNPRVKTWSDADLNRFAYEWNRYFRGDIRVKKDTEVTEADIKSNNLILFGDPGSNSLIKKVLPSLPIKWDAKELEMNGKRYSSADHAPALIHPNPLSPGKYVVINSGHTFHESELNLFNYLLFPRLGDWAVMKLGDKTPANPSQPLGDQAVQAGYFDEEWKFKR